MFKGAVQAEERSCPPPELSLWACMDIKQGLCGMTARNTEPTWERRQGPGSRVLPASVCKLAEDLCTLGS